MKDNKSITGERMFWSWVQIVINLVIAVTFLTYAMLVENGNPCFSDGVGTGR